MSKEQEFKKLEEELAVAVHEAVKPVREKYRDVVSDIDESKEEHKALEPIREEFEAKYRAVHEKYNN